MTVVKRYRPPRHWKKGTCFAFSVFLRLAMRNDIQPRVRSLVYPDALWAIVLILTFSMLRLSKTGTPFYIPTTWRTALLLSVIGFLGFVGQVY